MHRPRIIALSLAFITLLAYAPVMHHGFVNLDDNLYVTQNPAVQAGLAWRGFTWAFTTWHASNWHPLTWLSHMLDCDLYGLNAGAHHVTNVLFHTANAVLLLVLLLRATGQLWPSAFVAALFAWHPLCVESAAWIAERKNVLSTFFGLLALLAYVGYAKNRSSEPAPTGRSGLARRRLDCAVAVGFFALSLLAKPMLVTLPFVMLLLDYWPLQRFPAFEIRMSRIRQLALEKWPFFLLSAGSCALTFLAQRSGGMVAALQRLPLELRLCNAPRSYGLYLWRAIWPTDLCILYPYPSPKQLLVALAPAMLLLLAVTWMAWRTRRQAPYLLVGWLWFLGTLVPVIGFVQVGGQAMNDHHAYVPLIGLFTALAFGVGQLIARFRPGAWVPAVGAGLVLGGYLLLSEHQLGYWRNSETLFSHALAVTKNNAPAHNNLGAELASQGRAGEARTSFQEAVRIEPLWADPHNNLGNLLRLLGRPEEALPELSRAVQLAPNQPVMRNNLGETLAQLGRSDEALLQLDEAARLDPSYGWPHLQIARLLVRQGRDSEALEQCREALRDAPENPEILTFTAHFLSAEENPELRDGKTAVTLALKACSLTHGEPRALDVLGMACAEAGDFANAELAASNAIQFATAKQMTNIGPWRQRLELYRNRQPWRESFQSTNLPPKEVRDR